MVSANSCFSATLVLISSISRTWWKLDKKGRSLTFIHKIYWRTEFPVDR
jgi:hypothetical protein